MTRGTLFKQQSMHYLPDRTNHSFPDTTHVARLRGFKFPTYFVLLQVGANLVFVPFLNGLTELLLRTNEVSSIVAKNTVRFTSSGRESTQRSNE